MNLLATSAAAVSGEAEKQSVTVSGKVKQEFGDRHKDKDTVCLAETKKMIQTQHRAAAGRWMLVVSICVHCGLKDLSLIKESVI